VSLNQIGKRYELEVSNEGEPAVEGATVIVYHPRAATVSVSATKAWMPEATVRRIDEFSSQVLLSAVGAGHHQYTLAFE
jgi:hypothetical protein